MSDVWGISQINRDGHALGYLIGYVGINLYTMGKALHYLLGVDVLTAAIGVACFSAVYVTWGGQTSVIVTDLFQGIMLFATGLLIFWLGFQYFDGAGGFWGALKPEHRMAFTNLNKDSSSQPSVSSGKMLLRIQQSFISSTKG